MRMPFLGILSRGSPLFILSLLDIATPFVRMLVLTHFLDLRELGFASALSATYGMFEQITDIAMYRFVFSSPRGQYEEALGAAHALSVARGAAVGVLVVLCSPLMASIFGLREDWRIFAAVGAVVFIRSFEHLGPRVSERDYRYGAQLKSNLTGAAVGFAAMLMVAINTRSHLALYVQLLFTAAGYVIATHIFSESPYRLNYRTPLLARAFRFGYPLMVNGVGLAVVSQGDRMLVGALLGLPTLGVYSIVLLATTLPISMVLRITSSITLAALLNVSELRSAYVARMKLAARVFPLLAAGYGLGVVTLANIVVPVVFGEKFRVSIDVIVLLGLAAFFRIARNDPFSSILLQTNRTKRLALVNLSALTSLMFAALLMYYFRTIESAVAGRLLGELAALAFTLYMMRDLFRAAIFDFAAAMASATALVGVVAAATYVTQVGNKLAPSLTALALAGVALLGLGLLSSRNLWRVGFTGAGESLKGIST